MLLLDTLLNFWTADFLEKSEMMLRIFSNKTEAMLCGIASAINTEGKKTTA